MEANLPAKSETVPTLLCVPEWRWPARPTWDCIERGFSKSPGVQFRSGGTTGRAKTIGGSAGRISILHAKRANQPDGQIRNQIGQAR